MQSNKGPLSGLRVLEVAGIGPGPFCAMLLADLGADVVVIERPPSSGKGAAEEPGALLRRGKRSVALDLKSEADRAKLLRLIEGCDALIEGMRPGVMERLGLGPELCLQRNPRLVYGRMTGWGQTGPLAQAAGHDINYIALSGALWYAGQPGQAPLAPPSLIGDIGGGALYLAVGILAAVMHVRAGGHGQVVDAAIVDGSAHMQNLLLSLRDSDQMVLPRGQSLLDGPHWFNTYRCADGHYISVGSVEPKFYALLCSMLGLEDDADCADGYTPARWPALREKFARLFAGYTRKQWCHVLEGTDACFAPVLNPDEAAEHPHMQARQVFDVRRGLLEANPAPRFSAMPLRAGAIPQRGADTQSVLQEWTVSNLSSA